MKRETRKLLEKLASRQLPADEADFNVFEASGGNYDDAYQLGLDAGETWLALEILEMESRLSRQPPSSRAGNQGG